MNISFHFRMTFSPLQPSLPPPSNLHPHQGRRGVQIDEICSTSAPHLNLPTQACTSQPQLHTSKAKSRDTPLPHLHYTTNKNKWKTYLGTTSPSKRKNPQDLPRKKSSHLLSWPQSLIIALALFLESSPPAEVPNLLPTHLHPHHPHRSLLLPRPRLCPLGQCQRPKLLQPLFLLPNSSLLQWRFTGPMQNLTSMRYGRCPKLEVRNTLFLA